MESVNERNLSHSDTLNQIRPFFEKVHKTRAASPHASLFQCKNHVVKRESALKRKELELQTLPGFDN